MLVNAYSMIRGLGSTESPSKGEDGQMIVTEAMVGNARAGLWIGEKLLSVYSKTGNKVKEQRQQAYNAVHRTALAKLDSIDAAV